MTVIEKEFWKHFYWTDWQSNAQCSGQKPGDKDRIYSSDDPPADGFDQTFSGGVTIFGIWRIDFIN